MFEHQSAEDTGRSSGNRLPAGEKPGLATGLPITTAPQAKKEPRLPTGLCDSGTVRGDYTAPIER